ncbi:LysR family transcriptional regulator [Tepidibacillus fermentans]|uniref:LysR family transcriptional regulator n=1 Tax=Tepidibacillus fermentans TaxID=1281767 RepID=A0A4R3K634_9BACI|nr:LysR family transcriptional regulator [Tepidibacillus fermentans]TCS78235.1 LysR family transcriptional regulator [Tepidibacillus fermentans]
MQTSNLEVFLLVAEMKSLSKAAKLLHLTQPAVSNKIHMIEEQFNITLFERSPYGVTLTEAGQTFYQYAKDILHIYHEMVKNLHKYDRENQKISIGAESVIGNYFIPCKIAHFREKFPSIDIKIITTDRSNLLEQLEKGEINIACIDGTPPAHSSFHSELISTDTIYLAVPNHQKWSNIEELTIEELCQLPIILPDEKMGLRQSIEETFQKQGIDMNRLHVAAEISSVSAIKSLVESGFGVSFLCDIATRKERFSGSIKLLKISSLPLKLNYHIVYQPDKIDHVTKQLIRYLLS